MATVRCGIHNVRVNLADEASAGIRNEIEDQISTVLKVAVERIKRVMLAIKAQIESAER